MAKISIIIPIYNAENFLMRCLESISMQTESDFECILVDDGSTDSSLNICREFAFRDNRFVIISQSNKGPSAARNRGLDNVKSQWITFIDADDYVTENYLANFLKYNNENPKIQVIQGYFCEGLGGIDDDTLYPSSKYEYTEVSRETSSEYIENHNLLYNWGVWCKVFSADIINKYSLRFEELLKCGEDGLFWHKYLCYVDKIVYVPEQGYTYFCPKNNISVSRIANSECKAGLISLASNYFNISKILIDKFSLKKKSALLLRDLYLINYFKSLLKYRLDKLDFNLLNEIRPSYKDFDNGIRNKVLRIVNVLPLKFANIIGRILLK